MIKNYELIILFVVIIFSNPGMSQSNPNSKIKDYLYRNDILELIGKYGEDEITLSIAGIEQKQEEKRSYQIVSGFRCQLYAGTSFQNANELADKIRESKIDSVYVFRSADSLYKVQAGNCKTREEAQVLLDKLYYAGVKGAWIVEADIHIPKKIEPEKVDTSAIVSQPVYFGIQILTTKYEDKAIGFETALKKRFKEDVLVIRSDSFYKVVVGRFREREAAQSMLEKIRAKGFSDAWVTQVME